MSAATTPTSWRAFDPLLRIAGLIATLALPVLLITLAARVVIFSPLLYEYGFRRYGIEFVTLIPYEELLKAADETRAYFDAPGKEPLHIVVQREGKPFELYNQREVAHMADVKLLVQGVDQLRKGSLAILLATLGIGLVLGKRAYLARFGGVLFRAHEWATREQTMRSYELFARYVMPVFQGSLDTVIGSNTWSRENRKQIFGNSTEAVTKAFTDFGHAAPMDAIRARTLGARDLEETK